MSPGTAKRGAFARAQKQGGGGRSKIAFSPGKTRFSVVNTPRNDVEKRANDARFIANKSKSCGFRCQTDHKPTAASLEQVGGLHARLPLLFPLEPERRRLEVADQVDVGLVGNLVLQPRGPEAAVDDHAAG